MDPQSQPQPQPQMQMSTKKTGRKTIVLTVILTAIVSAATAGGAVYFLMNKRNNASQLANDSGDTINDKTVLNEGENQQPDQPTETNKLNNNELVVKEWGLKFRVPDGLTDVHYVIKGDTAYFYGKPEINYRADYDKNEENLQQYAQGVLIKSKDKTKYEGASETNIEGTKIGDDYYYSWHSSISPMATGAAPNEVFITPECEKELRDPVDGVNPECSALLEMGSMGWSLINNAMFGTIKKISE